SMSYSTYGMNTLPNEAVRLAQITNITFENDLMVVHLTDGRALQLDMNQHAWLRWLLNATPEQRQSWEIVPSGGGVWWPDLDDGVELQPLLDMQAMI
ncbi:MAG: DUF2442 domain-containing protein, partial [Caldilineaceae bacterium]